MAPSHTATTAGPKRYKVPLVRLDIPDRRGNTTRQRYVPLYELPLVEAIHRGALQPGDIIGVSEVDLKLPKDMRIKYASRADEEARLAANYDLHPVTKVPIFSAVYPPGKFREAYADVVEGRMTVSSVKHDRAVALGEAADDELNAATEDDDIDEQFVAPDTDVGNEVNHEVAMEADRRAAAVYQMKKVKGIGAELAGAIYDTVGFSSIDEIAECEPEELEPVAGVGLSKAKAIKKNALKLKLEQDDQLSQGDADEDDPSEE